MIPSLTRQKLFLSTLSLRRATFLLVFVLGIPTYFYPRSPCGERPITIITIYIAWKFLSTLSLRRATVTVLGIQHRVGISIHALLAESDVPYQREIHQKSNFYPRSPCGERPEAQGVTSVYTDFYPRSPCGERRPGLARLASRLDFYPRSPCGERRIMIITICTVLKFLSTLSLRRATVLQS